MKRLIAGAVVAGVAVFAGVGALGDETTRNEQGTIEEGGGLGAFRIQQGDCLNLPTETLVASVEGVPCWEPHDAQAYYLFDMTGYTDYPGETAITSAADNGCIAQFHPFVGKSYELSELDITWLAPTADSWSEFDDREITCMVVTMDGSQLDETMRGSGR